VGRVVVQEYALVLLAKPSAVAFAKICKPTSTTAAFVGQYALRELPAPRVCALELVLDIILEEALVLRVQLLALPALLWLPTNVQAAAQIKTMTSLTCGWKVKRCGHGCCGEK
jgi:hypothetical protein